MDDHLRFPIGKYNPPSDINVEKLQSWIDEISTIPKQVESIVNSLSDEDLALTYRPGGWNIRQVVHHLGDSHLNSYIRFKWALTENSPKIKAYDEAAWAELGDSSGPVQTSVDFLKILHVRWTYLMKRMSDEQWERTFTHPQTGKIISLKKSAGLYAWHGKHHLAHIKLALGKSIS